MIIPTSSLCFASFCLQLGEAGKLLLDEAYACSQQQQQQQRQQDDSAGSDDESSVLYIATDDEELLRQQPDPAWLLTAVADAAYARTAQSQRKATAVVRWLLNSLPEARLAEHPSIPAGLLAINRVPQHLARELCKFGVKVPYKEIVAAARRRVEGEQLNRVEVWIAVQSSQNIPPILKVLCSNSPPEYPALDAGYEVDDADLPDLLHLSINSIGFTMPGTSLNSAQPQLRARQLPADAVATLMRKALEVGTCCDLLTKLCGLPAAQHISRTQLSSIVEAAAAANGDSHSLRLLAEVPAFHQLRPATVAAALQAAVRSGSYGSLQALLGSRSAVADDVLVPAVELAVQTDAKTMLMALLSKAFGQWKASITMEDGEAARFTAHGCFQVLAAAVRCSNSCASLRLWNLPAVRSLQGKQLGQLLRCEAATPHGGRNSKVVDTYFKRHRAWNRVSEADLSAWQLRQTVKFGVDCSRYMIGPFAPAVDVELLGRLLKLAVTTQHSSNLKALLTLPACAKLDSRSVSQLLEYAVTAAARSAIKPASSCHGIPWSPAPAPPAASNLPQQQATSSKQFQQPGQVADAAVSCLSVLCQWDAAADLYAGRWIGCVKLLLQSPGAAHITPAGLGQVLLYVFSCYNYASCAPRRRARRRAGVRNVTPYGFPDSLFIADWRWPSCSADALPRAASPQPAATALACYIAGQLATQLRAAVQQQDGPQVAALCACPAAAELDLAVVHELLLAAAALPGYTVPPIQHWQLPANDQHAAVAVPQHTLASLGKRQWDDASLAAGAAEGSSGCGGAPHSPAERGSPSTRRSKRQRLAPTLFFDTMALNSVERFGDWSFAHHTMVAPLHPAGSSDMDVSDGSGRDMDASVGGGLDMEID
uniref:Uncharacterized protein n=1 Tax=Tetradesmus obliquus TaxID=3088 RepID=A0A383WDP0_TETOB|eukprot:jgi/Sobl393_1/7102/SZX75718.1